MARLGIMPGLVKKPIDNIPKLANVSLVLTFPGYYGAKGALSLICRPWSNHRLQAGPSVSSSWDKLGKAIEKGD